MLEDFKAFVTRGRVVDFAVGVVVGVAFGTVINSFVVNLFTPIIAIPGTVDFSQLAFQIGGGTFRYGQFVNDLIGFLLIAAAVFLFVVRPLAALAERDRPAAPPSRQCPECLSTVPAGARRCPFCTSVLEPSPTVVHLDDDPTVVVDDAVADP